MSARRRTFAAASTLAALSLVLAACGGDDEPEKSDSSEPTEAVSTANALTLNGQWPLTGERLEGDLPEHPVYVVKIDNTSSSAPQLGLDQADMVVEEQVEGGLTRLAAFFYENTPDIAGPVRSMRATDIGIVSPVDAVLVAAGGATRPSGGSLRRTSRRSVSRTRTCSVTTAGRRPTTCSLTWPTSPRTRPPAGSRRRPRTSSSVTPT